MPCKLPPNTRFPIQALLRFKRVRNRQNRTSLSASSSSSAGISTSVEATGLHSPGGQLNQTLPRTSILVLSPGLNTMETVSEEEEKGNNKAVVCVTGGSGYIASWLVKLLLQRGYLVRATVRDPADPKKTEHLLALDGAKERLQLFRAELMEQGSFDSVVDGCDGVFHTASPVFATAADPQAEIIDPAVEGTLNVLRSCAKVPSLKRVVLTSSMAAVMFNGKPLVPGAMVDESWFSDIKFCEETKAWYKLSKTLAEKAASDFAQQNKIDLVTLAIGTVFGPLLQPTMNASVEVLFNVVNGSQTYPNRCFRFVDVRDVAHAHVLAFENPSAGGRYCIVATVITCHEVLRILRTLYPTISLPTKCDYEKPFGPADLATSIYQVSRERAEELGVKFTAVDATIRDTVESLNERGFLQIPT